MTREAWIEQAKRDAHKIRQLIRKYHPANTRPKTQQERDLVGEDMTAPAAEMACEDVRGQVREQFQKNNLGDPVMIFDQALDRGDVTIIYKIMNQTWFGVPETTACWSFPGFPETVDLMDDPPDLPEPDGGDLSNGDHERDLGSHGPGPHGQKS